MRSIELTLDDDADAAVRADWAALAEAELPSLAAHTSATNRPHLTLAAGEGLADSPALREALGALPVPVVLGSVVLFGDYAKRVVLARQVVVTPELIALHARVHDLLTDATPQTRPGAWTPHVTLSARLPVADLPRALALLGTAREGAAVGARLWDGVERALTALVPASDPFP